MLVSIFPTNRQWIDTNLRFSAKSLWMGLGNSCKKLYKFCSRTNNSAFLVCLTHATVWAHWKKEQPKILMIAFTEVTQWSWFYSYSYNIIVNCDRAPRCRIRIRFELWHITIWFMKYWIRPAHQSHQFQPNKHMCPIIQQLPFSVLNAMLLHLEQFNFGSTHILLFSTCKRQLRIMYTIGRSGYRTILRRYKWKCISRCQLRQLAWLRFYFSVKFFILIRNNFSTLKNIQTYSFRK